MSPRFAWLTTTTVLMPEPAKKKGTSTKAGVSDSHRSACKRMGFRDLPTALRLVPVFRPSGSEKTSLPDGWKTGKGEPPFVYTWRWRMFS